MRLRRSAAPAAPAMWFRRSAAPRALGAGLLIAVAACEPGSINEARNQIGQGPARTVEYNVPVGQDSFVAAQLLGSDTITTPSGLIGIRFDPQSLFVPIGEELHFDNIALDTFTFSYDQMLRVDAESVTVNVDAGSIAPAPPAQSPSVAGDIVRFSTAQGSRAVAATAVLGRVIRRVTNNSGCAIRVGGSLVDSLSATVLSFAGIPVNDGATVFDTTSLAGISFAGYLRVLPSASGAGSCTPTGSASVTTRFEQVQFTSVTLANVNETFSQSYAPLASEARINAVDTVDVFTGSFTVSLQNRLPIPYQATITLNGVTLAGAPLQTVLTVPTAPGDGTTITTSVVLNLAGARLVPGDVTWEIQGRATALQATVSGVVTTDAVVVAGVGNMIVQSLSGSLNPTKTPELTVPVDQSRELTAQSFDFGDFQEAVRQLRLNDASVQFSIDNEAEAPLTLFNYQLGVVELTAEGEVPRDGAGKPVFQTDSLGQPIVVPVADPGMTTVSLARGEPAHALIVPAAPVLDRLIHLVLDNKRAAVVGIGSASIGDGAESGITRNDCLCLGFTVAVGLDITVPATGVTFTRTLVKDGLRLNDQDADELAERVLQASASSMVSNGTPFGVEVSIAAVPGTVPDGVSADSIFNMSNRIVLTTLSATPGTTDAQGLVTQPSIDTVTIPIRGVDARVFMGQTFSTAIRVKLLPGAGSARGAIRPTDRVVVRASASVQLTSGGG